MKAPTEEIYGQSTQGI